MVLIHRIKTWIESRVEHWGRLRFLNECLKKGELPLVFDFVEEFSFITRGGYKGCVRRQSSTSTLSGKLAVRNRPQMTMTWRHDGTYIRTGANPHHIYDIDRIVDYVVKSK